MHMQHTKIKSQSVQKIDWKQTDGQTGGCYTDFITIPANAVSKYVEPK